MLNMARLRGADLLPEPAEAALAEVAVPGIGWPTGEGESLILLRMELRAQAAASTYRIAAGEAAKRGAKLVAAFSQEASVLESQLAKRVAELGQQFDASGEKEHDQEG